MPAHQGGCIYLTPFPIYCYSPYYRTSLRDNLTEQHKLFILFSKVLSFERVIFPHIPILPNPYVAVLSRIYDQPPSFRLHLFNVNITLSQHLKYRYAGWEGPLYQSNWACYSYRHYDFLHS